MKVITEPVKRYLEKKDRYFIKNYYRILTIFILLSIAYNYFQTDNLLQKIFLGIFFLYITIFHFLFIFNVETNEKTLNRYKERGVNILNLELSESYALSLIATLWVMILTYYSLFKGDFHFFFIYSVLMGFISTMALAIHQIMEDNDKKHKKKKKKKKNV